MEPQNEYEVAVRFRAREDCSLSMDEEQALLRFVFKAVVDTFHDQKSGYPASKLEFYLVSAEFRDC